MLHRICFNVCVDRIGCCVCGIASHIAFLSHLAFVLMFASIELAVLLHAFVSMFALIELAIAFVALRFILHCICRILHLF